MNVKNLSPSYYKEYLEETYKIIREQDQSSVMSGIVREIETHASEREEKERYASPKSCFF